MTNYKDNSLYKYKATLKTKNRTITAYATSKNAFTDHNWIITENPEYKETL